ncbi:hypothetical protein [Verrucomicrobium sp. BvORR106]|uniref:hypothetical protein n=1 Tax=Verrucomicrobium sp. BvORR106 TaxID=1403819 RepID=UPI00056E8C34|nr:hypothetical protein [Verrucomicrobium sp. BvORR106]
MNAKASPPIPPAEWIVAGIGLVVFASVLGLMVWDAVAGDQSPPRITVQVDSIAPSGDGFLLKFLARNDGGETAAEVVVDGESPTPGGQTETASATLDFLPAHSERRGGFFFKTKPDQNTVRLRASSFREP